MAADVQSVVDVVLAHPQGKCIVGNRIVHVAYPVPATVCRLNTPPSGNFAQTGGKIVQIGSVQYHAANPIRKAITDCPASHGMVPAETPLAAFCHCFLNQYCTTLPNDAKRARSHRMNVQTE